MGKDAAARRWTVAALVKLCKKLGRMVSAGELAKFMGVSRNTALKRLEELYEESAVDRIAITRKNTIWQYWHAQSGRDYGRETGEGK